MSSENKPVMPPERIEETETEEEIRREEAAKGKGERAFEVFCAAIFLGMIGLVFFNAFLRYVFRSSFAPSEEWARFLFIYITFIGGIEAFYRHKHIAVDMFVNMISGASRKAVDIVASLFMLAALVLLLFGGISVVLQTLDTYSVATDVNMAFINGTLPVMAFAAIIIHLRDIVRLIRTPASSTPRPKRNRGENMELVVFLVSLFGFLALGIPIAIVLVLCSMVLMYYGGMWDSMFVMIIPQSMLDGANNYPLMAIPFFVFAGEIMTEGGLSKRVVKLAQLIIGRVRGGLGYAAIVSSVIFAGLMGSSVGEAAALGSLLLPMMAQAGYKPGRAGGVIASGAILGPIIPPSTNFILLGATVGLSITKLFMIGLVPGLIIGLCLMVTWFFIVRIDGYKEKIEFKKGEASKIVRDAMPAFMMPVLLLGGIRFGVFTPTEGGAFACVYAIAVCTLYYRELTFKGLLAVSARAARTTSVVMLIVATATAVGWFITSAQIPMQVAELFQPLVDSPILLLLSINVFLFLAGMVMDLTPNVLIFAPVFYPLIQQAGIDPYFFGLLFILNLGIGVITPPVGTVLYVVCGIGNIKIGNLVRNMAPFLIVEMLVLFLLLFFPSLSIEPMKFLMK